MNIWLNFDAFISIWYILEIPFCYTMENRWSFKHKILGHVGPLGKTSVFCLPWDLWISWFSELSIYTEVVLLEPFHNTLNHVSTANIEEVMKFYNLGDNNFEKDFNVYLVDVCFCASTHVLQQ